MSHPLCKIPPLTPGGDWIASEKGALRPERALAYNRPELLLHDAAATRPGHCFSAAELAGYGKTAHRLLALLRPFSWVELTPLEWRSPEELLFCAGENRLLYDLVILWDLLEQAEAIELLTLPASVTALAFRRC